ncbi:MAG: OmpH family outer membrane protein [SAR116 cluster bacterium]|nr:MAG: OmpH family outer membrane protein [SAR116 cluster bacterium]|tara:strand:+ start:488 stop:1195 length:708 start_codon:yes stop_codon:yes gene_type:complete
MMADQALKIWALRIAGAMMLAVLVGGGSALAQSDNAIQTDQSQTDQSQTDQSQTDQSQTNSGAVASSDADQGLQMQVKRIGLIDLDGVLRRSTGTAKVRQLLDEQRLTFQEEFTKREAELQAAEKALQADRELLSEEAFNERLKSFEDEVAEVQQQIQYRRQTLDRAFQEAQRNLRGIALEIVKQIAGERKLDLVLSQESALIFVPSLNISDEVLVRLDERTRNARIEIKVGADE